MEKSLAFEEFEDSNNILVSESHSNGKRKRVKHKVSLLAKAREHVFQRADTFEPKVPTRSAQLDNIFICVSSSAKIYVSSN